MSKQSCPTVGTIPQKKPFDYILYHCMILSKFATENFVDFPQEFLFKIISNFIEEGKLEKQMDIAQIILYGGGQATIHFNFALLSTSWRMRRYEGAIHGVRMQGLGKLTRFNGDTELGYFENNKRVSGNYYFRTSGDWFEGPWERGMAVRGIYHSEDGELYDGELVDGVMHGYGTRIYLSGEKYKGEWRKGKRSGQGTFHFLSGDKYEGEWEHGNIQGQGTMHYFLTGDRYEGRWANGLRHGKGKMFYLTGDIYEGDWRADKKSGKGTVTYATGDKYNGEFRNDKSKGGGTAYHFSGEKKLLFVK